MVIYKIVNLINKKIYVGKDLYNNSDYLGSGLLIKKAINKYGEENFKKEIIEECSENNGHDREIYWIKRLNSTNRNVGYNISKGGKGGDNFTNNPRKEDIRKEMRNRFTGNKNPNYGKKWTEERKEKVRKKMVDRKPSEETLKKLSKAHSGKNNGMYGVSGQAHPNYGKKTPDERKGKISISLLKYWENNPEKRKAMSGENNPAKGLDARKKNSEKHKGKALSKEHKLKISKGSKGRLGPNLGRKWSEEVKNKISASLKGRPSPNRGKPSPNKGKPLSEETKKKISMSLKKRFRERKEASML